MKMLSENYYNRLQSLIPIMERFEATQIFDCPFSVTRKMQEAYDWLGLGKQDLGCRECVFNMAKFLWSKMKEYQSTPEIEPVVNNLVIHTIDVSGPYDNMSINELKQELLQRGLIVPKKATKGKLIKMLG
jgi:hypothetical protein